MIKITPVGGQVEIENTTTDEIRSYDKDNVTYSKVVDADRVFIHIKGDHSVVGTSAISLEDIEINGDAIAEEDAMDDFRDKWAAVFTDAGGPAETTLEAQQIIALGTTPGIAGDTAGGLDASCQIAGSDVAGLIQITPGESPGTNGVIARITFSAPFTDLSPVVMLSPANAAAAALTGNKQVRVDLGNIHATYWEILAGATALDEDVEYRWFYHVIGANILI